MGDRQFIVLCGQVLCTEAFTTISYNFDGQYFDDRKDAIKHGFELRGSDDFNIGVISNGFVTSLDWMNQTVDEDPEILEAIQQECIQQ